MTKYKTYGNLQPCHDYWWKRGELPNLCMALRMGTSGTADYWSNDDVNNCLDYLRYRLQYWRPSSLASERFFDAAVRLLVEATISEVEIRKQR